jgi:hypothetical protein
VACPTVPQIWEFQELSVIQRFPSLRREGFIDAAGHVDISKLFDTSKLSSKALFIRWKLLGEDKIGDEAVHDALFVDSYGYGWVRVPGVKTTHLLCMDTSVIVSALEGMLRVEGKSRIIGGLYSLPFARRTGPADDAPSSAYATVWAQGLDMLITENRRIATESGVDIDLVVTHGRSIRGHRRIFVINSGGIVVKVFASPELVDRVLLRKGLKRGVKLTADERRDLGTLENRARRALYAALSEILDRYGERFKAPARIVFSANNVKDIGVPADLVMMVCARVVSSGGLGDHRSRDPAIASNYNRRVNRTAAEWRRDLKRDNHGDGDKQSPLRYGILAATLRTRLFPEVAAHVRDVLSMFPDDIKEYCNADIRRRRRPSPSKPDMVTVASLWRLVRGPARSVRSGV